MARMRLRRARSGEEDALTALALRSKAHWGYDAAFLQACRIELSVTAEQVAARQVWVAETDARVVGMSVVDFAAGELLMLFVEADAIGTGVGRALLDHARAQAAAAGLGALTFESDPNAEPFYLAQGARRIGERVSRSTGRSLPLMSLPAGESYAAGGSSAATG
jgi:GNAT superfamily N-acetyltransferase